MPKQKTKGNRKSQKQLSKEFRGRTYCMRDILSSLYECIGLDKFPCKEKPIEPKEPKKPRKQRDSKRQNDVTAYNADVERYNKELNEYHIEMKNHKAEMIAYNKWLDEHVKGYVNQFMLKFNREGKSNYNSQPKDDSAYSSATSLPNIDPFQQHQCQNYSSPLYISNNQQDYVPSQPINSFDSSHSQSFEQQNNSSECAYQLETNNWAPLDDIFPFDNTYFSDNSYEWISNRQDWNNSQNTQFIPTYYSVDPNNYSNDVPHQQHCNESSSADINNFIREYLFNEGSETMDHPVIRKRNPTEGLTNDLRDRASAERFQEPVSQAQQSYKKRASGSEWHR